MVLAYATSDWHIPEDASGLTWRDVPGVAGDALFALGGVVALCVRDRVPLIAAGDLVDNPDVTPEALAAWFTVLRPLSDVGLPVFAVTGNHDRSRDWLAAFGPLAVRLDDRVVTLPGGVTLSGLSYVPPAHFAEKVAAQVRVSDIGVYHQAVADFGVKGLALSQFPAHSLAVIGDTHVSRAVRPAAGPRLALSPGPLAPQSVAEFGPPGVWAVHADLSVTHVKIPARAYHRFDVGTPAEADACVAAVSRLAPDPALPPAQAHPMIAARLTADLDGFAPALRELCGRLGFPLRVLDAGPGSASPEAPEAGPVRVSADLPGILVDWPGLSPGARRLALALADPAADPGEVLDADRAAWEHDPDQADVFDHD